MADITMGLPTLPRPEDIQAQQDRAALARLGATVGGGVARLGAATADIATLPGRALMGAANGVLRLPNAFGAGIPAFPNTNNQLVSPTPYQDMLRAPANTGGVTGSFGDPIPAITTPPRIGMATGAPLTTVDAAAAAGTAPAAAPVQAVSTPAARTSTTGGRTSASMPAGAPAPLVPGETGFFLGNDLVPYGTRFLASGSGGVTRLDGGGGGAAAHGIYDNLPGGGKMVAGRFVDPRDALEVGFRKQSQYRDESIQAILAAAGNGGDLGYRAKVSALAQAFGSNNFGATSVGGANSLNSAIANVDSAGISAGGTLGAARIRASTEAAQLAENQYQHDTVPKAVGQTSVTDSMTGLTTNQTSYALPPVRGVGGMPRTIDAAKPKSALVDGTIGFDNKAGKATIVKDGKWAYQ